MCVLLLSILTPLILSSSVSMPYFILAIHMSQCLEKHSCMSSTFPIAILNITSFRQCNYTCTKENSVLDDDTSHSIAIVSLNPVQTKLNFALFLLLPSNSHMEQPTKNGLKIALPSSHSKNKLKATSWHPNLSNVLNYQCQQLQINKSFIYVFLSSSTYFRIFTCPISYATLWA